MVRRLDLPSKLEPLEGNRQQGTIVSCFCFLWLWVVIFLGEGGSVGCESPPLISENSNRNPTYVQGIQLGGPAQKM
jgi:hypothetical protein